MRVRHRLVVPALLFGLGLIWAAAHGVVHKLVAQSGGPHAGHVPGQPGPVQAYASYVPTSLALCLALGIALAALARFRRTREIFTGRTLWFFGLVPVMGFGVHALLSGTDPVTSFTEFAPAFLVGLLLQLPFALVSPGITRTLLHVAERLAFSLVRPTALLIAAAPAGLAATPAPAATVSFVGRTGRPRGPPPAPGV